MQRLATLVLASLVALLPAYAMAEDALKETIQAREDQWSAAYNAHDTAALGAIYEIDATIVPPGSVPTKGREAIEAVLASLYPILSDIELVTDDVTPLGADHAVEVGHLNFYAVSEDGTLTPGVNNYVVVWHLGEDGIWRYVTDIFNER